MLFTVLSSPPVAELFLTAFKQAWGLVQPALLSRQDHLGVSPATIVCIGLLYWVQS
jgi:hypothetical protein